ncbi:MAG: ribonuclease M5, partial [Peptococcaceae bacterium]|nr:ribonuclease M5 [Peptococcaceae bacterium]
MSTGMEKPRIKEVVVVEGKDDVAAVKRACLAQTITTSGLGISREMIGEIRAAQKNRGVIILTDPDAPGGKIRRIIEQEIPGCKHAYLYRDRQAKDKPVGVEYASPQEILAALEAAKATIIEGKESQTFSLADMLELGLVGGEGAR